MNEAGERPDALTPAERRLLALMLLLRTEPPGDAPAPDRVVRTARMQLIVRDAVQAVAGLAAAVADGLAVVFGTRRGERTTR